MSCFIVLAGGGNVLNVTRTIKQLITAGACCAASRACVNHGCVSLPALSVADKTLFPDRNWRESK